MLNWIKKLLKTNIIVKDTPSLFVSKISSYYDYNKHLEQSKENDYERFVFEKSLLPKKQKEFSINGYCYACKKPVKFLVDFIYSCTINDVLMPNWREWLVCPRCHLNNRMRAAVHVFEQECQPNYDSLIYITEQTTSLYNWLNKNYNFVHGSEYLGTSIPYGSCNDSGIRNEDITELSISDNSFDYILSYDVFEHIPNYMKALEECFRCLRPKGILFFSLPFIKTSQKNITRAYKSKNGKVKHLSPPEYHANPLSPDGCLCFHHFGWEVLDKLNAIEFENTNALLYWSQYYGYLGGEQVIFKATKPN